MAISGSSNTYVLFLGWSMIKSVLDGVLPLHAESPGGNDLVVKLLIKQGEGVDPSILL